MLLFFDAPFREAATMQGGAARAEAKGEERARPALLRASSPLLERGRGKPRFFLLLLLLPRRRRRPCSLARGDQSTASRAELEQKQTT